MLKTNRTSSSGEDPEFKNIIGKFKIPFLLDSTSDKYRPSIHLKNFLHIHNLPSLRAYLQLYTTIVSYGKFYRSENDCVVNYLGDIYNLVKGNFYLAFDAKKSLGLSNWKLDQYLQQNLIENTIPELIELEEFVEMYFQPYHSRVRNNVMIIKH